MAKKKSKQIILSGGKMKFNVMPHPMHGGNFWDDVKGGFSSVGNFLLDKVAPKLVDVAIPLATKALLGAGKRRKMRGRGTVIKA